MKTLFDEVTAVESLYLLDANGLLMTSYHSPFRNLSVRCADCGGISVEKEFDEQEVCVTCGGTGQESTKAVYLFVKTFLALIRDKKPTHLAAIFDGPRHLLHRRKLYPAYKAAREGFTRPTDIEPQLRRIKQILKALGIVTIQAHGDEADDILATLATELAGPECETTVVTRDKDLYQLCVNPDIFIYDPMEMGFYGKKNAGKKFGVRTKQLVEFQILTGDSGDGIKGCGGFGPKTSAKYLEQFDNLAGMVAAAEMGLLTPKLCENLIKANNSGWLKLSRQLLTLNREASTGITALSELRCPEIDLKRAGPIFRALDFKSFLE